MTNPYIAADMESCVVDEVALQELRARITEAIETAKKTFGSDDFVGDTGFLQQTIEYLDRALSQIAPTMNAIQEGMNEDGD